MNHFTPPDSHIIPQCPTHGNTMELFDQGENWEHWKCTEYGCDYEESNEPDYE